MKKSVLTLNDEELDFLDACIDGVEYDIGFSTEMEDLANELRTKIANSQIALEQSS